VTEIVTLLYNVCTLPVKPQYQAPFVNPGIDEAEPAKQLDIKAVSAL
jgi:hypothetical protein